jgi:quercetin dioxygenase-like cupin family protein
MSDILNKIPASRGIRTVPPGEGKAFDFGPVHFKWKVRSEDSSHSFTMFELDLAPDEGVDLHSHPSPETFYVLEGSVTFYRVVDGEQETIICGTGTTVIIPPNALHALFNESEQMCRLLDVSTPSHQAFFDVMLDEDKRDPFANHTPQDARKRAASIARHYDMYLAPYDVKKKSEVQP